jgi:ribosomal-protein-alanine N-acetyltransferase
MLRLRPFSPSDIKSIQFIVENSMREKYPASMFLKIHDIWGDGFIVCDYSGQTVGFIAPMMSGPGTARILVIAVLEILRGQGIGSALLNAFTNECIMKGLKNIELEVRPSNKLAIRFYMKHGYQVIDTIPAFYKDGEDGYKMWKTL